MRSIHFAEATMPEILGNILTLIPFYLIGAIPTGYLIARSQGIDITAQGSGNVGATNVGRVLGKNAGIATLIFDISIGAIAAAIAALIFGQGPMSAAAGAAAVCGHCISIPGKMKGGKGVATSLGVLLALTPVIAVAALTAFILVFSLSRIVSLSSVCAAAIVPLTALLTGADSRTTGALLLIALVVIYRHHENLQRLSKGTEKKFSFGGRPAASA